MSSQCILVPEGWVLRRAMYASGRDVLPRLERGVSDGRAIKENDSEGERTCSKIFEMRLPSGPKASSSERLDFDGGADWTALRTPVSVKVW